MEAGRAWAQNPPGATDNLKDLSVQDIRGRLRLLDKEHSLAIAEEDYDKAGRIVREINRLDEELLRRHWEVPVPRPPNDPRRRP